MLESESGEFPLPGQPAKYLARDVLVPAVVLGGDEVVVLKDELGHVHVCQLGVPFVCGVVGPALWREDLAGDVGEADHVGHVVGYWPAGHLVTGSGPSAAGAAGGFQQGADAGEAGPRELQEMSGGSAPDGFQHGMPDVRVQDVRRRRVLAGPGQPGGHGAFVLDPVHDDVGAEIRVPAVEVVFRDGYAGLRGEEHGRGDLLGRLLSRERDEAGAGQPHHDIRGDVREAQPVEDVETARDERWDQAALFPESLFREPFHAAASVLEAQQILSFLGVLVVLVPDEVVELFLFVVHCWGGGGLVGEQARVPALTNRI